MYSTLRLNVGLCEVMEQVVLRNWESRGDKNRAIVTQRFLRPYQPEADLWGLVTSARQFF